MTHVIHWSGIDVGVGKIMGVGISGLIGLALGGLVGGIIGVVLACLAFGGR